jgi:hypothetical protein
MRRRIGGPHRSTKQVMPATPRTSAVQVVYRSDEIVDAPEHHEYARAMGLLSWGTWDAQSRPFDERVKDFLQVYPPEAPARFQGSMLARTAEGEYAPAPHQRRLERVMVKDSSVGTLEEVLARFGLKLRTGPEYRRREIEIAPFREITRARNQRLRVLHGRVDVEADNMDEAKAAEIERLERKQAAEQIRAARERMKQETSGPE